MATISTHVRDLQPHDHIKTKKWGRLELYQIAEKRHDGHHIGYILHFVNLSFPILVPKHAHFHKYETARKTNLLDHLRAVRP